MPTDEYRRRDRLWTQASALYWRLSLVPAAIESANRVRLDRLIARAQQRTTRRAQSVWRLEGRKPNGE